MKIEVDEYDQLLMREGKDYSQAHQALYLTIVELLRSHPAKILEIGTGIGFGLKKLLEANCVEEYVGIEPSHKCIDYVNKTISNSKVELINQNWLDVPLIVRNFDVSLCIEIIEHIEKETHLEFVKKIHAYTNKIMFFSTPDVSIEEHGLLTHDETMTLLRDSGFKSITYFECQLPHTLYMCNP